LISGFSLDSNINMDDQTLSHSELTAQIINCFFESYNKIGFGFNKSIYLEALEKTMIQRQRKLKKNHPIDIKFEMDVIGQIQLDLVVEDKIIIQITADDQLMDKEIKRMFNFLRQSQYKTGLLLNYGETPSFKRRDLLS